MSLFQTVVHRWLRIPYPLHYEVTHPKAKKTVVFLHGIGNSTRVWDDVIKKLPEDVRCISIDLLGFGQSPRPEWPTYNAKTQARSVWATLLRTGTLRNVTVVGHSLGAIVAVELAKRYPVSVSRLVLCSPPFYQPEGDKTFAAASERLLRKIYRAAIAHRHEFIGLAAVAKRYRLVPPALSVTTDNVDSYMATLQTMIVNQTSLHDASLLKQPIVIMHGLLDPLVISKHFKKLAQYRPTISLKSIAAGHDVTGLYVGALVKQITALTRTPSDKV